MSASAAFRERLLSIMEHKNHWAWPAFADGRIPLPTLYAHFSQEWEVYVRDFPILLARVLGRGPPPRVRAALAANIYEEQTGGLSGGVSHPELFLRMMEGCNYRRAAFENVALSPNARRYREALDRASWGERWVVGAAVLTLFVEGSVNERRELAALQGPPPTSADIEDALRRHPLARFHGVSPEALELVRVHRRVEGGHREDAWEMVLENVAPDDERVVEDAMNEALALWLAFRDDVAAACGLTR